MNIIIDKLPNEYEGLKLNTGFRSSILFELMMKDNGFTKREKLIESIMIMYEEPNLAMQDLKKAFDGIMWFLMLGKTPKREIKEGKEKQPRIYDFEQDAEYIYSAFMRDYKIDLQDVEMHWWKFKSLFDGLSDDNLFIKILGYRSINLDEIKDKKQQAFYMKMKNRYALEDGKTEEEKEQDFGDALW